ncbi:Tfp pilus assembly protein, tip-associated adhesin PilY1 [Thiocystis violascens DSM 198]|uniref:Tfp pilus assembly protein, tip-associated adhesin PilY1 n=2 Tax=Thiocystis violascens TaxID=73141 RepID=I3YAS4_THIV6|nr:Tfp pilus assembly protein, tip-associated adhesin PilY1 [Thiocystis violascens DSM 198]
MNRFNQNGCDRPRYRLVIVKQFLIAAVFGATIAAASAAPVILNTPLITNQSTIPMSMMVVGRDHTLFYEAYNDASDLNGDGILDVRFKPSITYYGLFDSSLCYSHSGGDGNSDKFSPNGTAGALGTCASGWSGNWLNYATTSRIDALRKVFYGGYRDVDTNSETVLRRAYIPQDAHSWAKEYTSTTVDGYDIANYTPLGQPPAGKRHFFGNLTATAGVNCSTLSDCSDKPPLLRVVRRSDRRVWNWASTERPVLKWDDDGGVDRDDYTVRVEVCTGTYSGGCKRYPNGSLKPIGLLHEYGENDTMLFGLLTGSYNKNKSGGVLRKVVSSFKSEVNANTGQFIAADATIVNALNNLRIRDFNNNRSDNAYRGGWVTTRAMNEGEFIDWGNPTGEMMYETLRYFAGKASATTAFATTGGYDAQLGLPVATWDDPYDRTNSAAKAHWCARPNMMVVSGINPSFDSDQVPGTAFGSFSDSLGSLNVATVAQTITTGETGITGMRFIGQSGTEYDGAPTAKNVASLGTIRGLAPEEPTKQGSYYSAAVAHYGKITDLRTLTGTQTVDTYSVVLSSPLPRIEAKTTSGSIITLVPFAKSVGGESISNTKGQFQPTNQIVDFYVDTIVNTSGSSGADYNSTINGGRYYASFRINFEDVEQGADHDMDAIVVYEISAEADGNLKVKLTPEYQAGGIQHSMGYVISGTKNADGVYLVVQDENVNRTYYLNVPPGQIPGYCDVSTPPAACQKLPYIGGTGTLAYSERFFEGGSSGATLLRDPLWFASKWGGFVDFNDNDKPDLPSEWDADNNGVPDTYFLVQNPLKLREALKKSLDTIVERSASAGNITSNGQKIDGNTRVFQSQFNSATWDGELFAFPITSSGVSATPSWKASEHLPVAASRKIFAWNDATTTGIAFTWASLSTDQQTALGSANVLDYLRGDQSKEIQNAGIYRTRKKLLGDIVHSSPYYVKDTDTVYVGGNDGMLHAFNAVTGAEVFAYIPGLVFGNLAELALPTYSHKFFVDGDLAVSSLAETPGKNILIGSTGRGIKGLFALNVTTPGSFAASNALWEYSGATDDDLGFVLGRPQIGTLENDAKVVVFGNGHNSVNGKAVLYVFGLETGTELKKIPVTAGGNDNGLSTPTLYDSDGNGKIDTVYAGDLKGNVWRFDVTGAASAWDSHYLSGTTPVPFFTAMSPVDPAPSTPPVFVDENKPQAITAQLTVAKNTVTSDPNYGKTFLFFGTGSYVYQGDPAYEQVQSWYGLIDDNTTISSRTNLALREIKLSGTVASYDVRAFSEATAGDMTGKKGWVLDLMDPDPRGERIVTRSNLYQLLEPVLIASSIIPDDDPCEAGGSGFVNAINPFTGARLGYSPFDLNDDAQFDESDKLVPTDGTSRKVVGSFDPGVAMPGEPSVIGDRLVVGGSSGDIADMRVNLGNKRTGRLSWREIKGD